MINFNVPINNVSFGQISVNLLYEAFKNKELKKDINVLPIGNGVDTSAFSFPNDFREYIHGFSKVESFLEEYSPEDSYFKLWHINGAFENLGNPYLMTFHETSELTRVESNILNNLRGVIVTSNYTKGVFEAAGVNNVHYVPLGFDKTHFRETGKVYLGKDIINFDFLCFKNT